MQYFGLILQSFFKIKIYSNKKKFYAIFPPVNKQKVWFVHALQYYTQYMKVACWFKGGGGDIL